MAILMNWNTSDKELEMMVNSWKAAQTFISTFPNMWYAFVHTYSYGWRETCWELKLISSLYCALSKVFLVCIYLHELDSKFQKQPPLWIQNSQSFMYHLMKQLCSCKISKAVGRRIWKASKIRYAVRNK